MSDKANLFFRAMGARGKKPSFVKSEGIAPRLAEGGEVEEQESDDGDVSPEEKLAAFEILEAMGGGISVGSEGTSKAVRLAKALKSFFLIVDSQPHSEGPHREPGESPE